jgi:hypothetical protein
MLEIENKRLTFDYDSSDADSSSYSQGINFKVGEYYSVTSI